MDDPYELVLADLRAKRAQIDQAISALENLRGGAAVPKATASIGTESPEMTSFVGMNIADAVKRLLELRRTPLGTREITAALITGGLAFSGDKPANTVGSVLHRQAKTTGEVISVGRGKWALADWHPNLSRSNGSKGNMTTEPGDSIDAQTEIEGHNDIETKPDALDLTET